MNRIRTVLVLAGLAVAVSACYYQGPGGYYGPHYYHHPHYYWGPR
ncbi:hypothetical protein [Acidisoma silvae]|nr:hypothetical protein [Acidisoma silvae]